MLVGAVDHQHPEPGKGPADVFFQRYNHGQQKNKILVEKETINQRIKKERHRLDKWNGVEMYQTLANANILPKKRETPVTESVDESEKEKVAKKIRLNNLINKKK